MKAVLSLILVIVIIAFGAQLVKLHQQGVSLKETASKFENEAKSILKENSQLEADLKYFSNPDNLIKELKSRLNYKKIGEEMMIVIPPRQSTSSPER